MLKAVRFDLDSHRNLIEYIENYRDKRGKPNHSEAIRILMEKGFNTLNPNNQINQRQDIDLNKFKEDIIQEMRGIIGENSFHQETSPASRVFTQVNTVTNQEREQPLTPKSQGVQSNSLLGNILNNAKRS